jgi:uncharacterized membrane protein YfcA
VVTFVLILTLGSLAAGAGIGGGGLFVPIYAILLDVGAKPAVPLSKCTILGAAIGNFVSIGFGKHPNADRPLIDYETSTFMQAGELMGVTFGVLLNLLLPEIVIMVFLAMLLSYNSIRTLRKGRDKYRKESLAFELEERREGSDSTADLHGSTDDLVGLGGGRSVELALHPGKVKAKKGQLNFKCFDDTLQCEKGVRFTWRSTFISCGCTHLFTPPHTSIHKTTDPRTPN